MQIAEVMKMLHTQVWCQQTSQRWDARVDCIGKKLRPKLRLNAKRSTRASRVMKEARG